MSTFGRRYFVEAAVRPAEEALGVPPGWWGSYRDVAGPDGQRVRLSRGTWIVRFRGKLVSRHDSRSYAIKAARKLPPKPVKPARHRG